MSNKFKIGDKVKIPKHVSRSLCRNMDDTFIIVKNNGDRLWPISMRSIEHPEYTAKCIKENEIELVSSDKYILVYSDNPSFNSEEEALEYAKNSFYASGAMIAKVTKVVEINQVKKMIERSVPEYSMKDA